MNLICQIVNNILQLEFTTGTDEVPELGFTHIQGLKKEFVTYIKDNPDFNQIKVDMKSVDEIDSSGITLLIAFKKLGNDDIYLYNVRPRVEIVMAHLRMTSFFKIKNIDGI